MEYLQPRPANILPGRPLLISIPNPITGAEGEEEGDIVILPHREEGVEGIMVLKVTVDTEEGEGGEEEVMEAMEVGVAEGEEDLITREG